MNAIVNCVSYLGGRRIADVEIGAGEADRLAARLAGAGQIEGELAGRAEQHNGAMGRRHRVSALHRRRGI